MGTGLEPKPWLLVRRDLSPFEGETTWPLWRSTSGWCTFDGESISNDINSRAVGAVTLAELDANWIAGALPEVIVEELAESTYVRVSPEARRCYAESFATGLHSPCAKATAREIVGAETVRAVISAADRWRPWENVRLQLDAIADYAAACGLTADECGDLVHWRHAVDKTCELEAVRRTRWQELDAAELRILFQIEESGGEASPSRGLVHRSSTRNGYWSRERVEVLWKYWDCEALTRSVQRTWSGPEGLRVTTVGMRVQELAQRLNDGLPIQKGEVPKFLEEQ